MQIISLPEDYAGALSPVEYRIAADDPAEITEVLIEEREQGDATAIKRFRGEAEYTVNIAPYMRRSIDVQPSKHLRGIAQETKRWCVARIGDGATFSQERCVTGGTERCKTGTLLSNSPRRLRIAHGERDEMAIAATGSTIEATATFVEGDSAVEVQLGTVARGDGIYVLVIDDEFLTEHAGNHREMRIEIKNGDHALIKRDYRVVQPNRRGKRVCWQNPYGQIDYYTFEVVSREYLAVNKKSTYSANGYRTAGAITETHLELIAQCENNETVRWLTEIASAPQVWIDSENGFEPADILTDKCSLQEHGPVSIQITARMAQRKSYQR